MKTTIALMVLSVLAMPLYGQDATQPPPMPSQEQPEVLTRGPVHEAFAEPVDLNTAQQQQSIVAPSQPPDAINENPPDNRPVGNQFVWVPGYWGWDADRNGYIWVSGCWRAAPPNRYWVPGYWAQTGMGWTWVPGFWAQSENVQQIEYLPEPPVMENVEPIGVAPSPDNIWVPPCWYWHHGRYVWRPGYWLTQQEGWVWTPSHYTWAPRGYVFVAGHWDYSLTSRGILFAPVYFPRHYYSRPGFSYSLSVAVDLGNLEFSLFTYPRYSHYYFGDYYDTSYISIGIYPWYHVRYHNWWYDPIYVHHRYHHRHDRDWDNHIHREYDRRRDNRDLRPPRTYRDMEQRIAKMPQDRRRDIRIAESYDRVVANKQSPMKFERIRSEEKRKITKQSTEVRRFGEERSRWEASKTETRASTPTVERREPVQPERRATTPQPERRENVTPQKKDSVSPTPQQKATPTPQQKATPAPQQKASPTPQQKAPEASAERRQPPRQEVKTQPEQVKIPKPPIEVKKDKILRKQTPSQPSAERKTENVRKSDVRQNREPQRRGEPQRDSNQQNNKRK